MKGIDTPQSTTTSSTDVSTRVMTTVSGNNGGPFAGIAKLEDLRTKLRVAIPDSDLAADKPRGRKNILNGILPFTDTIDYCDNDQQIQVLRHHYFNEFALGEHKGDKEVLKDYRPDSVIHKVVDGMPSTYRGLKGAIHAWHDLSSYMHGPCQFDLTHISVCQNHAQVNWKAKSDTNYHVTLYGTDSFTFDDTNHIQMQTTVALSQTEEED